MNYKNLQRIYDHIQTIPEELLDMISYREENREYDVKNHQCNSVGCVLGHSIILDDWKKISEDYFNEIDFKKWSFKFLEFNDIILWKFLFSGDWSDYPETNNKEQILKRIQYIIKNGNFPPNFLDKKDKDSFNFNIVL